MGTKGSGTHSLAQCRQGQREVGRDGGLADSALARRHCHDVVHAGQTDPALKRIPRHKSRPKPNGCSDPLLVGEGPAADLRAVCAVAAMPEEGGRPNATASAPMSKVAGGKGATRVGGNIGHRV